MDIATGKEQKTLRWQIGPVFAVAFSPDNKMVAAAGRWECQASGTRAAVRRSPTSGARVCCQGASLSADGNRWPRAPPTAPSSWDVATHKKRDTLPPRHAEEIEASPSGRARRSPSGSRDRSIRLWNLDTLQVRVILRGH